ncbi:serine/threonine-protein kinase [Streptomyces sp. CSDS2]|uniref:serine/threonine-protein kinase n=1 Tax=Streptomyces sp. CSDS2 TaxID=3055051 RepID=UPI0025AF5D3D|nr:serine/threonine-protein kinase [Streptomyces sp. CSDS2]MDN3259549.1 serine/threonine-protein kinase [Streptomyces sp. CSDS2]
MEKLGPGDPPAIGAYRLLARLGAGGMGQVYLARSDRGRTVAVKLVRAELAEREEFRARFRQEVHAARRVGGYWTAPVLDADTEADVPWVATGYVAGPSLQQVVGHDHGALPERSVRILAAGLAQALADIHAAGLVHRDLKPSNVLVTIDGPRVIDFGIARALETAAPGEEGLTRTGALVGSPGFMAPEQVRGDRITPASDVFCLGSVLAYAATGSLPFGTADSGVHALMFRIAQEEPDLTGVPEGIADLVRDCLRKDPASRPSPAEILERTGMEDTVTGGRSRDPWLPSALVAQLGRHAVRLLEAENPEGAGGAPAPGPAGHGNGTAPPAGADAFGGTGVPNGAGAPHGAGVSHGAGASQESWMHGAGASHGPGVPQGSGVQGAGASYGTGVPDGAGASYGAGAPHGPVVPHGAGVSFMAANGSPEHAPVSDGGAPEPVDHQPAAPTPRVPPPPTAPPAPHGFGPAYGAPPPRSYPRPQPHPTGYGYPQHPGAGAGADAWGYGPYAGGPGATPPYGPPDPAAPEEPERRSGRSTALLVVVALVVAVGAGGSVYALMNNGGTDEKAGGTVGTAPAHRSASPDGPAAPPTSAAPTPTASRTPAAGAIPDAYLGTWRTAIGGENGTGTRELTIRQGEVGDTVLTLVADGPTEGGGSYHCVFEAELTAAPGADGPLRIGPSTVTTGEPASSCTPGEATEVTLLPDGRLERTKASGGESLTYRKE